MSQSMESSRLAYAAIAVILSLAAAPARAQDLPALRAQAPPRNAMWLEDVNLHNMSTGYGVVRARVAVDGGPLKLRGVVYPHGIGTHTRSRMSVDLKGVALRFVSLVGVDDDTGSKGAIQFKVFVDGKKAADSGPLIGGGETRMFSIDLTGAHTMVMDVQNANKVENWGHADWAGAMLLLKPGVTLKPESVEPPSDVAMARSFIQFATDERPAIHGPRVVGASPHRPFLFLIPATGKAPLTYSAEGLPAGLALGPRTGILSGAIANPGDYTVQLTASGPSGKAARTLKITCGNHKLAQTPPLGWNAWNVYGSRVTADKVREQADWLIRSGLAAHGFQYVIIDDSWQGRRDAAGAIGPSLRFGDIKSLADYIHRRGLKLGICSSPTENTCSGYVGSAQHEAQDAKLYASWGVDYLKYDWCRIGTNAQNTSKEELKAAFQQMGSALEDTDRDIVYAINPYGFGDPWEWAATVGANSWRTGPEIQDEWQSVIKSGLGMNGLTRYSGPGRWSDPGWLMVGKSGVDTPHFSRLKPAEQAAQLSLWSLLAAPLMLSCDLGQLNPNTYFPITTALLTNDEVLDIDQDPLGRPGVKIGESDDVEVWSRPLADGTTAVGLFNREAWPGEAEVKWSDLGLTGSQPVRDLWQHKDLGAFTGTFTAHVPGHGAVLVKVGASRAERSPGG